MFFDRTMNENRREIKSTNYLTAFSLTNFGARSSKMTLKAMQCQNSYQKRVARKAAVKAKGRVTARVLVITNCNALLEKSYERQYGLTE